MNIPKPADDPQVAEQRAADALESVLANAADRAFVLVAFQMAIKAHRLEARRLAMDEIGERFGRLESVTH